MEEAKENKTISDLYEYEILDEETKDGFRKSTDFEKPMIRFKKFDQVMPFDFLNVYDEVRNFETREDDVWICSQAKSGSTWMGELVWCLQNSLNLEEARSKNLDLRMMFLEIQAVSLTRHRSLIPENPVEMANKMKSPRLLKSHLSFDMIPRQILEKQNKIIYVMRNPRDLCVSLYNHYRLFLNYTATFEEHVDYFIGGTCGYYQPLWSNIKGFYENKHLPNLAIFYYEDMIKDLSAVIDRVIDFLGLSRLDEDSKKTLMDHLNIKNMKENPAVNRDKASKWFVKDGAFINKGIVGNWKNFFTPEITKKFEKWEEEGLKGTDLKFVYEI